MSRTNKIIEILEQQLKIEKKEQENCENNTITFKQYMKGRIQAIEYSLEMARIWS